MILKTYNVFESKVLVEIPELFVDTYELHLGKLDDMRVSYLAYASGGKEHMSSRELTSKIIKSIITELELYMDTGNIVNEAKNQGLL